MTEQKTRPGISVTENGPYHVTGGIPLARVRKVTGDRGEFVEWEIYERIETEDEYWLCRCGHSTTKPFCSGMHDKVGFDGTEAAQTDSYDERSEVLGGTKITVRDDRGICAHAAYCTRGGTNVWKAAPLTDEDEDMRDLVVRMIDRCPSGALTYWVDGKQVESELEMEIWVQEDASYVLRGGIPIRRADGQPLEIRNRMALCRCGESKNKPLCDGTHWHVKFTDG